MGQSGSSAVMRTVSARGLRRGGVSNFARKVVVDDYLTPGPSSATIAASFPKREAMRTLLRVDGSTKVARKTNPLLHRGTPASTHPVA